MSSQEINSDRSTGSPVRPNEMFRSKVFFVQALDKATHKEIVYKKVQDVVTEGKADCPSPETVYLGHCGWTAVGQVVSPTYFAMGLCRKLNLLPSERCTLLPLRDQYQAIQLCLARINKKKSGEFSAPVSDVLDVWNELYRETVTLDDASKLLSVDDENNDDDDCCLNLPSSRRKSHDPVVREMQEIVRDYQEFIKSSGFIDHFFIFSALKKWLKEENDITEHIGSKVFILEGVDQMLAMERELLKLLLIKAQPIKVVVVESLVDGKSLCDFDMSGIGEDAMNTSQMSVADSKDDETVGNCVPSVPSRESPFSIEIEHLESGLDEYIEELPRSSGSADFSDSELYVEHLILAHIRLLVNTRDELAIATLCSMPGREITQQGFHDIKEEAQKKNMPIYQTILSFIMRLRLGGKGYQADPDCPLLLHSKPLGEFVDSIMKLQNIVEEEPNPRKGAVRVLSLIKNGLLRIRGRALKAACIEKVWEILYSAFCRLTQEPDDNAESKDVGDKPKLQQTTGALRPCLKLLIALCDEASSRGAEEVDSLSENFVTQCNSSKKTTTPIRIPTVLSLFSSPVEGSAASNGDDDYDSSLRMRLMACKGQTPKTNNAPKFKSGCSWAPDDLSPVHKGDVSLDTTLSPIVGPTLRAVGKTSKSSQNWREIVEAVSQDEEERRKEAESLLLKEKASKPSKGSKSKPDEKKSKRSLLTDISNIAASEANIKKSKTSGTVKKSPVKKKSKALPVPKGQKPITSFFKV
ncbi:PCNA-interacting partner-like [Macrobrachium rosenbergii]|uniref:PCNA-interacting partner-like n=1 Tax=Macrobrachium rosenbergii TaxID=79674 RepID=UPI0034D6D938